MRQKRVYIPAEKPLLRYEDWDPVLEQARWGTQRDDAAFVAQLRQYAQRAAVYAARSLLRDAGSATDAEWFEAVMARVRRAAAVDQSPRPRTGEELLQRHAVLRECYTEMATLLLAWAAVIEAREQGYVDQGLGE